MHAYELMKLLCLRDSGLECKLHVKNLSSSLKIDKMLVSLYVTKEPEQSFHPLKWTHLYFHEKAKK